LRHHLAGCKDLVNMEIGVLETLVGGIRRMGTDVLRIPVLYSMITYLSSNVFKVVLCQALNLPSGLHGSRRMYVPFLSHQSTILYHAALPWLDPRLLLA
jgi:hypothetical protein